MNNDYNIKKKLELLKKSINSIRSNNNHNIFDIYSKKAVSIIPDNDNNLNTNYKNKIPLVKESNNSKMNDYLNERNHDLYKRSSYLDNYENRNFKDTKTINIYSQILRPNNSYSNLDPNNKNSISVLKNDFHRGKEKINDLENEIIDLTNELKNEILKNDQLKEKIEKEKNDLKEYNINEFNKLKSLEEEKNNINENLIKNNNHLIIVKNDLRKIEDENQILSEEFKNVYRKTKTNILDLESKMNGFCRIYKMEKDINDGELKNIERDYKFLSKEIETNYNNKFNEIERKINDEIKMIEDINFKLKELKNKNSNFLVNKNRNIMKYKEEIINDFKNQNNDELHLLEDKIKELENEKFERNKINLSFIDNINKLEKNNHIINNKNNKELNEIEVEIKKEKNKLIYSNNILNALNFKLEPIRNKFNSINLEKNEVLCTIEDLKSDFTRKSHIIKTKNDENKENLENQVINLEEEKNNYIALIESLDEENKIIELEQKNEEKRIRDILGKKILEY